MDKKLDDFGFEFIGNPELEYDESYTKLVRCVNLVTPLINNLLSNEKANVIHWPAEKRIDQLTKLKTELNLLLGENRNG